MVACARQFQIGCCFAACRLGFGVGAFGNGHLRFQSFALRFQFVAIERDQKLIFIDPVAFAYGHRNNFSGNFARQVILAQFEPAVSYGYMLSGLTAQSAAFDQSRFEPLPWGRSLSGIGGYGRTDPRSTEHRRDQRGTEPDARAGLMLRQEGLTEHEVLDSIMNLRSL